MILQYIPDLFERVVGRVSAATQELDEPFPVYFDFGHYYEVAKNLKWKDEGTSEKESKYPLVWLVMDFNENMGQSPADYARTSLRFIIASATNPDWTMKERRDNSFLTYLYPVYSEFIKQISETPEFGMPSEFKLKHTKIDRPFWGGSQNALGDADGNLFDDFIDAIEIINLSINVKQKIC